MSDFVFKQFTIRQQKSAMKIGTDSVLLGCLLHTNHPLNVLDIGTGTGLLALMMAQRTSAKIDAVEIDEQAAAEASFNFKQSQWASRITLHQQSIQQFCETNQLKFDLIVTNPPYYPIAQHSKITQTNRSVARQTNVLPFAELITCIISLLHTKGSCWLVLPIEEGETFIQLAHEKGLFLQHRIEIKPKQNKPVNRLILEFALVATTTTQQPFIVYEDDGAPTVAYKLAASAFYIGKQFELNQ